MGCSRVIDIFLFELIIVRIWKRFPPASLKAGGKGEEKAAQERLGSWNSLSNSIIPNPATDYLISPYLEKGRI
jgi:hypothetical protein